MNTKQEKSKQLYLSNQIINKEASKRGIKVEILDANRNFIALTYGDKTIYLQATNTPLNNAVSVLIANYKDLTNLLLKRFGFPTPLGKVIDNFKSALQFSEQNGFPVVLKQTRGKGGASVYPYIQNKDQLKNILTKLFKENQKLIIEKHIVGSDFRFLIVDFKCVSVVKRSLPTVVGDGATTVKGLIDKKNQQHAQRMGASKRKVIIDDEILRTLRDQKMTPESIPAQGMKVLIGYTANQSRGGSTETVTKLVHPENKKLAEEIAKKFDLKLAGIDVITEDISIPYQKQQFGVIEINAAPGLGGVHYKPTFGKSDDVAPAIIDMLFPETKKSSR